MSDKFYAGTRKGLFRFEKSGDKWSETETSFLGDSVPMFLSDRKNNTFFAAVEHGHFGTKLHRSVEGKDFEELDPPVYPEKPDDVEDTMCPIRNVPIPWSLEKIWSLEAGTDGTLWCGTIPGGLFQSTDQGESWQLNSPLWETPERAKWSGGGYDYPGIHSIEIHPENPDDIILGISCGGTWRTSDAGKSWTQCAHGMFYDFNPEEKMDDPDGQDPHRTVRCPSAPDQMWTQHHCGIFRSTDDAKSWQKIEDVSPSGFGFAVAVHPKNPDTAWFVPAKKDEFRYPVDGRFVVTRTTDGGASFKTLTRGLPDGSAYDLVYRHALAIDETGDRLVMGSTTGSLWITENGGESWENLSNHLPPIYCVRFG